MEPFIERSFCSKCSLHSLLPFPEHTSKVLRSYTDPIMDTVNFEKSAIDESTANMSGKLTSDSADYQKETTIADSERVNEAGQHTVSIQVDASLIRFIKGSWGLTQKQIEREMGVIITFPSTMGESSIVIEGASKQNVTRASEKITSIIEQAVESPKFDYSHFVSLPLAIHPELVHMLRDFRTSVLKEVDLGDSTSDDSSAEYTSSNVVYDRKKRSKSSTWTASGIDKSIFIKPQTLHLTVLMLKLWNKDLVAKAAEILKGVSSKVMDALENQPVFIRLRGLACMKGSPAKARVVYVPIEDISGNGRLLRACQVIIDAYVEAGLVLERDARHSLKLHATLMNIRQRKRNKWTPFDARAIFEKYESKEWGEYIISEAHLSQRFVFDESGYYHCCGSIPFPQSSKIK